MNLLVVNAGSSSLKLGVLSPDDAMVQAEDLPSDRVTFDPSALGDSSVSVPAR